MTHHAYADQPNAEVVKMSPDEWREAVQRALKRLGLTFEQLAEEAKNRNFSSVDARKLWVAIGGRRP
jgi:hypothetical protein